MIKHKEIEIEPGRPFANCQLDRCQYANVLTSIVSTYADGFVLAINNKWGTGKTTFVKMWEQDLKDKNYQTVYFNAWENDFENNPLTALMGELKTLTNKATEQEFKTVLKRAATLSKHLAPTIIKAIADKYVDTQGIKEAIENITKGVTDIFENEVNEYAEKKKGIAEFRATLSKFIADTNQGKPVIFIVDELDRCRPDYAVSILEQIKHFFSVPNIVFVLSIDKEQLGNAVRGVYGSEHIDSDEYLRRFIDVEYSIPEPSPTLYAMYLYGYFGFDDFFSNQDRINHRELQDDKYIFNRFSAILFKNSDLTLRVIEKIYSHSRLVLRNFPFNNYVFPTLFLTTVYLKIKYLSFYSKIKSKELSCEELLEEFAKIFKVVGDEDEVNEIIFIEAQLVHYYNNYLSLAYQRKPLFKREVGTDSGILLVHSKFDKSEDQEIFYSNLVRLEESFYGGRSLDLGYLISKIDLTENFISK